MFNSVEVGDPNDRFIAWRIAQLPLILAVIYLITFALVWLAPGSPYGNTERPLSEAAKDDLRRDSMPRAGRNFCAIIRGDIASRRFRAEPVL